MFAFVMIYGMMVFRSVMEEKPTALWKWLSRHVSHLNDDGKNYRRGVCRPYCRFIAMGLISMLLYSVLSVFFLKEINKTELFTQQELVNKHGTNIDLRANSNFDEQTLDLVAKYRTSIL